MALQQEERTRTPIGEFYSQFGDDLSTITPTMPAEAQSINTQNAAIRIQSAFRGVLLDAGQAFDMDDVDAYALMHLGPHGGARWQNVPGELFGLSRSMTQNGNRPPQAYIDHVVNLLSAPETHAAAKRMIHNLHHDPSGRSFNNNRIMSSMNSSGSLAYQLAGMLDVEDMGGIMDPSLPSFFNQWYGRVQSADKEDSIDIRTYIGENISYSHNDLSRAEALFSYFAAQNQTANTNMTDVQVQEAAGAKVKEIMNKRGILLESPEPIGGAWSAMGQFFLPRGGRFTQSDQAYVSSGAFNNEGTWTDNVLRSGISGEWGQSVGRWRREPTGVAAVLGTEFIRRGTDHPIDILIRQISGDLTRQSPVRRSVSRDTQWSPSELAISEGTKEADPFQQQGRYVIIPGYDASHGNTLESFIIYDSLDEKAEAVFKVEEPRRFGLWFEKFTQNKGVTQRVDPHIRHFQSLGKYSWENLRGRHPQATRPGYIPPFRDAFPHTPGDPLGHIASRAALREIERVAEARLEEEYFTSRNLTGEERTELIDFQMQLLIRELGYDPHNIHGRRGGEQ